MELKNYASETPLATPPLLRTNLEEFECQLLRNDKLVNELISNLHKLHDTNYSQPENSTKEGDREEEAGSLYEMERMIRRLRSINNKFDEAITKFNSLV